MELCLVRKETFYPGGSPVSESHTINRYEVIDGCPNKGDQIPIRFYLSSTELTPSYRNVNNKFSCKYFLNLIFLDEEDRKYFKQ